MSMTRTLAVTIIKTRPGCTDIVDFTLVCHRDTQIVAGQTFEIGAPRCESVQATPIAGQIINRSDGTASVRMVCSRIHDFPTMGARLRRMPNVSDIKVSSQ